MRDSWRERAGLHGGTIEWSGRRSGGTTVTVLLPRYTGGARRVLAYRSVSENAYIVWFNFALNMYDEVLCMTLSRNDLVAFPRLLIISPTAFFFTSRPQTLNISVLQLAYVMCHTVGVGLHFESFR